MSVRRLFRPGLPRRAAAVVAAVALATGAFAAPAVADQRPTVSAGDILVTEGNSGTTAAVFTLTLTQPSPNRITVAYSTSDSSARAPGDYTDLAGQVVFPAGVTTRTVSVDVVGDTRAEGDEVFYLYLSSNGATVSSNDATATIVDDDPLPYVAVGNTTVTEGDTGTTTASFPVTLDRPSVNPVRVRYEAGDGSAVGGYDYTPIRGTLTIPPGQTTGQIDIAIVGDRYAEGRSEYFSMFIGDPAGARILTNEGTGIILDDDSTSALRVTDRAILEGNSGTTNMVFTVSLLSPSAVPVTAYYATSDGSAVAGEDYTARVGTLSFAAGETSKTISVPIIGDTADEGDSQYFNLSVSGVAGADVVDGSALGWIMDDDPTRTGASILFVDSAAITEPASGSANMVFTVSLQPAATSQVTVNYATSDSSAVGGSDYTSRNGTLTFAAGATSATVSVPVAADQNIENTEQFGLNLSGALNASIQDGFAYGYIYDSDALPIVSVDDVTTTEGDPGDTSDAAFEITLSAPIGVTASVVYSTGNNGATAGADYTAVSATAVFQPGETSKVVHVPVTGDTTDENDEGFFLNLSGAVNAAVASGNGYAVILDDDRNPTVRVDDSSVYEGTDGTSTGVFTVQLSAASVNTVTVNYGTSNSSASAPADYTAVTGTLTFAPGETSKTVPVPIVPDTVDENTEGFYLSLGGAVNATVPDTDAYMTILDDDSTPTISVREITAVEPDSGTVDATFRVTLSNPTPNPVTVNYATSDNTAVAPGDYTAVSGTLTFAPGETAKTVAVPIVGDTIAENNEFFTLNLGGPTNATLRDSYSYASIYNNDALPRLSITDIGVVEGNTGTRNATVTVSLQPASPNTVTVNYGTADGAATAASGDYVTTTGTLTFAAGQTTKTVPVPVVGDTVDESNEYFYLNLGGAVNAAILDGQSAITLWDDDPTGGGSSVVSVNDTAVVEGDSGTVNAVMTVSAVPAPTAPITVNYNTGNSSAAGGFDYTPVSGTLSFAAGETTKTVTIPVTGDTLDEGDEQFWLNLFSASGPGVLGDSSGLTVILGDDRSPLVTVDDVTVAEGGAGTTTPAVFTLALSQASPQPVTVDWNTADNTAVAPGDYVDDIGTVTFAPGQTTKTVTVTVRGDNLVDGDELFFLDLSRARGASIASTGGRGYGVIVDSDAYAVVGAVTLPSGAGVTGTTLTLAGNQQPTRTATTATGGLFAFDDVPDGRYTLTPTASGRIFAPANLVVDVRGGSVASPVFLSLTKPSISGRIVDAAGNGVPAVTVTRSGNSQATTTTTTNSLGYYGFSANAAGSYVVKPSLTGSTFSPTHRTVTLTATSASSANFTKS